MCFSSQAAASSAAMILDVDGEVAVHESGIVVEAADAGVDQPGHVLRAGWFSLSLVLGLIELAHQCRRVALRDGLAPQFGGHPAGAGAHPAAIHEAAGRRDRHNDHRAGRIGIVARDEGLIDPAASEGHTIGNAADNVGNHDRKKMPETRTPLKNPVSGRWLSILYCAFAGLAIVVLPFDPGIGLGEASLEGRVRLPAEGFLNEGVVAVAPGHAARGGQVIVTFELDAADRFGQADEVVDRDQLARTEVDRRGDQLVAVHNLVDAEDAVIDIHEAAGLFAVAPEW